MLGQAPVFPLVANEGFLFMVLNHWYYAISHGGYIYLIEIRGYHKTQCPSQRASPTPVKSGSGLELVLERVLRFRHLQCDARD
jgi:hypothetical protein